MPSHASGTKLAMHGPPHHGGPGTWSAAHLKSCRNRGARWAYMEAEEHTLARHQIVDMIVTTVKKPIQLINGSPIKAVGCGR